MGNETCKTTTAYNGEAGVRTDYKTEIAFDASRIPYGEGGQFSIEIGQYDDDSCRYIFSEKYIYNICKFPGIKAIDVSENGNPLLLANDLSAVSNMKVTQTMTTQVASSNAVTIRVSPIQDTTKVYIGNLAESNTEMTINPSDYPAVYEGSYPYASIPVKLVAPNGTERAYTVLVRIEDTRIKVDSQPADITCYTRDKVSLSVTATTLDGSTLSYQWYKDTTNGAELIQGAVGATFNPETDTVGTFSYYCVITATLDGESYFVTSGSATVIIKDSSDFAPVIIAQPESRINCNQEDKITLSIDVLDPPKGVLSYQWYHSIQAIEDEPSAKTKNYQPPTDVNATDSYYCIVTNTVDGKTYTATSNESMVTVALTKYIHAPNIFGQPGSYILDYNKHMVLGGYAAVAKIGNVTKDSEQDIKDARKAYDALTDLQKLLVDNYETLTAAETKFAMLDTLGKVSEPYISTGEYMEELGTPNVGAVGGEWMVIGLARSGRTVPGVEDYYQKAVEYVQQSIDPDTGRLHKAKSTDNSRMILALTAIGKDVTNVGGYNLLAGLSDLEFVKYQGNNGPIWALLALDSGNYPVPSGGTTTRQALIDEILSVQTSDGGWAISGDRADSDMTGMALTALAPYCKKDPTVKQAIDKAIARLSEMQDDDGGFSTTYGDGKYIATSESTAQVLTALSALGIDGDTDSRFVKNGSSVVDALLRYYVKGGGFKHIMDGEIDGMGTEQSYYALTAYYRFLSGKTNLYDMTDIIDMGGDVVTVEPTVPAATEPAQANTPWWIIVVCIFGGVGWGIVIGVVLVPKLKKKD